MCIWEYPRMSNPYFTKRKACFVLRCAWHTSNVCHQENSTGSVDLLCHKTQKCWNMYFFFFKIIEICCCFTFFLVLSLNSHFQNVLFLTLSLFHITVKKQKTKNQDVLKWFLVQQPTPTFLACCCRCCLLILFF